jgi:hypothetical protein
MQNFKTMASYLKLSVVTTLFLKIADDFVPGRDVVADEVACSSFVLHICVQNTNAVVLGVYIMYSYDTVIVNN